MKKLMAFSGLEEDRLRSKWISSAEAPEFVEEIEEFIGILKNLGPSPLKRPKRKKEAA
jgi:coenzyme F420-reducing hydrogenase delta subunit